MSNYVNGKHTAKPISYEFSRSKIKGTEQVTILFTFVGGPNDGKSISYTGYFTEATAKRTMDSLEYCGWDGEDPIKLTGFGSKNVELVVETERGQDGNDYPRVAWVNKVFSRGVPMTQDDLGSFSARMAAINAQRKKENAEKSGAASEPDPFANG